MARTYRPPKGVQDEAQRALQWIAEGKAGSGFTDVGRKRASDLAAGRAISEETVLRMYSYLSRHEVDKQGEGFSPGEDGYPSPGRVAWAAWGGDPGLRWATGIRDQLNAADDRSVMEDDMKTETRALPPSYRPASSEDVPAFTPSCASCCFFTLGLDAQGNPAGLCAKWEAGCDPEGYCDAWAVNEDALPAWMQEEDDEDVMAYAATPDAEARAAQADQPTADALAALLEQVLAVYARAHEAHWNVTSTASDPAGFQAFHDLFGEIYDDAHGSLDPIAENIRKLGSLAPALALPAGEIQTDPRALAADLLALNDAAADACRVAFDVATAAGQQGIANFLADRQDMHQKWSWQLRSSLGIAEVTEARRSMIEAAEKRTFTSEVRAAQAEDGSTQLVGYAAMWDREADGLPFREVIKRGAFKRSLDRGDDVFLLVNHDTDALPLARRSAGTLSLIEDEVGLRIEATLDPSNPRAAELASALSRGDVDKMSFAFRVAEDGSTKNKDGVRELRALDLFEVSVVTWPAYSATSVGMRSASDDDLQARWRFAQLRARHRAA